MQWTKPAFTDLRIGFEVTMYFGSTLISFIQICHKP
ncbi:pyrroloquinoline quinone precursor peptide PqqA [Acinetobacter pittii]|nr:pyrroloquinoline quinone precursor peptide PqqA [Acinetobacter pittii]